MNLRLSTVFLVIVGAAVGMAKSLMAAPINESTPGPIQTILHEKSPMVETPTSPKEVLNRIKRALEQELFLNKNFYSHDNLKWFIGDYIEKPDVITSNWFKYIYTTTSTEKNQSCIENGAYGWNTFISHSGKLSESKTQITGNFSAGIKHTQRQHDPELSEFCIEFNADTVVSIFGQPTQIRDVFPSDGSPPSPHSSPIWGAKSHPMGHSYLQYTLHNKDGAVTNLNFLVIGNGAIRGFTISQSNI